MEDKSLKLMVTPNGGILETGLMFFVPQQIAGPVEKFVLKGKIYL